MTPEEVFGSAATLPQIEETFSGLPRVSTTAFLCWLGAYFDSDDTDKWIDFDRRVLRASLLEPALRLRVDELDRDDDVKARVAFTRPQILLALRLAQHFCHDSDAAADAKLNLIRLGTALMQVAGLLLDPRDEKDLRPEKPDEAAKYVTAMLVALFESSNPPASPHAMKRTFAMLASPRWSSDSVLIEAASAFQTAIGLSPLDFLGFMTFLYARLTGKSFAEAGMPIELGEMLTQAKDQEGMRTTLGHISLPYGSLPEKVPVPEAAIHDTNAAPFRSRPLIEFPGDRYLCTDSTFLKMLMTTGLFWRIKDCIPRERDEDLFRAWGGLFEDYLHGILEPILSRQYLRSPQGRDGEITDGLVDYGSDVVLLEFKAAQLSDKAKTGRDMDTLVPLLEERLLKRDQIARALTRLFGKDSEPGARKLLKSSRVRRVYPVLVSYDHAVCSPFLEDYLDERLRRHLEGVALPRHPIVKPITVLSADDVDLLVPFLKHGMNLASLLQQRIDLARSDVTFRTFLYLLAEKTKIPAMLGPEYGTLFDSAKEFWVRQGFSD